MTDYRQNMWGVIHIYLEGPSECAMYRKRKFRTVECDIALLYVWISLAHNLILWGETMPAAFPDTFFPFCEGLTQIVLKVSPPGCPVHPPPTSLWLYLAVLCISAYLLIGTTQVSKWECVSHNVHHLPMWSFWCVCVSVCLSLTVLLYLQVW